VNERIDRAQERVAELVSFIAQLQKAAAKLEVHQQDNDLLTTIKGGWNQEV
jgi:hypothetical protein